ncbi:hypothetical protein BSK49_13145 [Paenibacillus odorifer]|uniref:hypothetical protein n=1 Tax=Paenibacillus odorifer TaxID=189426 RepID=UPI00096D76EB|nr:hypothetical protein [Paenibacillus odorifer]OMD89324.1 hypothetical protein BSK49_13145 [Paenibacillus odorifer]
MKILEIKQIATTGNASVQFIRIDPEDLQVTLASIFRTLMDMSWLKKFDEDFMQASYEHRANKTIEDIRKKFENSEEDKITSDAGEYVISELARETLVDKLKYLNIPLAELLGKKISGNPGFDFHSQNSITDTVIFGEAKYIARQSAYPSALSQVVQFIKDGKDIDDVGDLKQFCTPSALQRVIKGNKGFAVAFSAKKTTSAALINTITKRQDFLELLCHDEIFLIAVNL